MLNGLVISRIPVARLRVDTYRGGLENVDTATGATGFESKKALGICCGDNKIMVCADRQKFTNVGRSCHEHFYRPNKHCGLR